MSRQSYFAQARFWAREYRRRAPQMLARAVPPSANSAIIYALESRARPRDLSLGTPFPRARQILIDTHELAPSETVRIPAVGQLSEDIYAFPPVRVHELSGVQLDIDSGLVFSRDWVINGSGTGHRWAMDSAFITGAAVRVAEGRHPGEARTVAPLANVVEHYHFLMETLPQVLRIRQIAPDVVFLTSSSMSPFAREVLDRLGVRHETTERHRVVECDRVLFCEGFPRERTHPADMQLLSDTLIELAGTAADVASSGDEQLYLSRRKSMRALAREERLEGWLAERGFTTLLLEEIPLDDQVRALAGARVVVSPHGGGLANTIFMAPGGRVVELATGEWWSNAFRRIAHVRGHDYSLLAMQSTPEARWGSADEAISLLGPRLGQQ